MRIHADPDPDPQSWSEPVLCGWIRCEDVEAKTVFLLLFSLFLYEKEPEPVEKGTWSRSSTKKRTGFATLHRPHQHSRLHMFFPSTLKLFHTPI